MGGCLAGILGNPWEESGTAAGFVGRTSQQELN